MPRWEQNCKVPQRFWANVVKTDGCWEWVGKSKHELGYGRIRHNGRRMGAHKFLWESLNGPVPEGKELDHLCRNPKCVRPDHLEPVTHRENMMRSPTSVVVTNAKKTHCPKGHILLPRKGDPSRRCVECRKAEAQRQAKLRWAREKERRARLVLERVD